MPCCVFHAVSFLLNEPKAIKMQHHLHKTVRLPGYDYSAAGLYFVTICAHNRECAFGKISNDIVRLSPIGEIVTSAWADIPNHYNHVLLEAFIVMPNHIHGILVLEDVERRDTASCVTTHRRRFGELHAGSLGAIVRSFKSGATKTVRESGLWVGRLWQPGFYEHVICNAESLHTIQEYIYTNPQRWSIDHENPLR